MKRLTILFCFLLSQCLGGEIKYIQSTSVNAGTVSSASLAYTNRVKAGSLLVAAIRTGVTGRTATVTDSNGLWTLSFSQDQTTDDDTGFIFYVVALKEGSDTVKVAISGAANTLRFAIHEYSGFGNGSVDVSSGAQKDQDTAYATIPRTVHNGETSLFGFAINDNNLTQTITAGTKFVSRENLNCGGSSVCLATEDSVIYSTGGLLNVDFTGTGIANWACLMAAFRSGNRIRPRPQ